MPKNPFTRFTLAQPKHTPKPVLPGTRFTHDCTTCTPVGTVLVDCEPGYLDRAYDAYVCVPEGGGKVEFVARYGDDGPEYLSATERWEGASMHIALERVRSLAEFAGLV